ncbi:hypothetical protein Tco_0598133 [Tanacetum coccineum]
MAIPDWALLASHRSYRWDSGWPELGALLSLLVACPPSSIISSSSPSAEGSQLDPPRDSSSFLLRLLSIRLRKTYPGESCSGVEAASSRYIGSGTKGGGSVGVVTAAPQGQVCSQAMVEPRVQVCSQARGMGENLGSRIIYSITAQQTKLDLELVPKEKRLDIGKCNGRLNPRKIQRVSTFQVILDAPTLTPCYSAFLITSNVPEVYMHQDIFKICPRVQGQDFDALPTDEEIVSFLRDLGHTREIHSLNDVVVDQMHQPWRTFTALINRSLSGKTNGLDKLRLSRAQILWGMYH